MIGLIILFFIAGIFLFCLGINTSGGVICIIFGLFCIAVGIFLIVITVRVAKPDDKSTPKPTLGDLLRNNKGFYLTKSIGDFHIDKTHKKWCVMPYWSTSTDYVHIYNFDDIINFELVEGGEIYKTKDNAGNVIQMGLLFGVVGAVAAASREKETTTLVDGISINIYTKSGTREKICVMAGQYEKTSSNYKDARSSAERIMAELYAIKYGNSQ